MNVSVLVFEVVSSLGEELGNAGLAAPTAETRLFGAEGLDSVALVTLIADLEDRLAEETGKAVILADERAMSRFHSPFRTVGTLIAHVERIAGEGK